MHHVRHLAWVLLAATAAAQCKKPAIPEQGLALRVEPDVQVTYSDGSRTLGELWVPVTALPSCGWPLIVWVHGLGLDRKAHHEQRQFLAEQGFAVWSYDVRGQGSHATSNPGKKAATFDGGDEHLDLAEQIRFVQQRYGALLSARVGVGGSSQGAAHAWAAAALSGHVIGTPGRQAMQFPAVHAVAAADLIPEPIDLRIKDGRQFHASYANLLFSGGAGLQIDVGHLSLMLNGFLAQDPQGTVTQLQQEPGRPILAQLLQSRVPILASHSWLDGVGSARALLQLWDRLPAAMPRRLLLHTTGIHAAPWNRAEARLLEETRLRWFDRFLWNSADPVETEAPIVASLVPLDLATLRDPESLWQRRYLPALPKPSVRLPLAPPGPLGGANPHLPRTTRIEHRVGPELTPLHYVLTPALRTIDGVLRHAPLSEHSFWLPPLSQTQQLLGMPKVGLAVVPAAARCTIAAALYAHLPDGGPRLLLASESAALLAAVPHQLARVEFELSPIGVALPAGTRLEVVLSNHWILASPWPAALMATPEFTPGGATVVHGHGVQASWIELPLDVVAPGLTTPEIAMPAARPRAIPLHLAGGSLDPGAAYVLIGGMSGHERSGLIPPVRVDPWSHWFASLGNSALTQGFFGFTGAGGSATATFATQLLGPLPPELVGRRFSFGAVMLDRRGWFVTNPVDVLLY